MHAWDEPAETLLALAPARGAPLLMPTLGQPVEPAQHDGRVQPWWRGVDQRGAAAPAAQAKPSAPPGQAAPAAEALPKGMPWPID